MSKALKLINAVRKDEEGAALVEYALLIGLIAVVCIIVVTQSGSCCVGQAEYGLHFARAAPAANLTDS